MRTCALMMLILVGCESTPTHALNLQGSRGYCPICKEWHASDQMHWPVEYQGKTFLFCDPNCRVTFLKDPEKYLTDPQFNPPR